jgi:acetyl esterase/lipase
MLPIKTFLDKPSAASLLSVVTAELGVTVEGDVPYGPLERHRADIYRSPACTDEGPIVLFIYGGGWESGERSFYGFVGAAFAASGATTVIPDYRVYPEVRYPGFQEDAAAAYRLAVEKLSCNANTARPIFVVGHSAGAHIGALLCFDTSFLESAGEPLSRPAGFIGLSGPYAYDPTTHERSAHIFATADHADQVRPVAHVRIGAPPALMMHGARDTVVMMANASKLAEALRAVGTAAEAIEFENMSHTNLVLALARPLRWRAPVLSKALAFIRDHSVIT